jgi:SAM-dependent methyltransferase
VDPPEDHADEAASYSAALESALPPGERTLLELGSGVGHNALFMKRRFRCTLTDLSPAMLARSRRLNPECEHLDADMRSLRLGRTFDAVFVRDAIVYMTTERELAAVARTAFAHTRPGGAALFAPDYVKETFREGSELITGAEGDRSLRCIEWVFDPDPADTTYSVEYAFLLRDRTGVRSVHDHHLEGLFPWATWLRVLEAAGYRVGRVSRPLDDGGMDEVVRCRRPEGAR